MSLETGMLSLASGKTVDESGTTVPVCVPGMSVVSASHENLMSVVAGVASSIVNPVCVVCVTA